MKCFFTILIYCFAVSLCVSQTKNEREERITIAELPEKAKTTLSKLPNAIKRLKFYKETDGDHRSYEAKFKYEKKYYSIEFDTLGIIEDIEVVLKQHQFTNGVKTEIFSYFENSFKKNKLIKIQKQYVYTADISANVFVKRVLSGTIDTTINYEIIAEVTEASKRNLKEFTFDQNGKFVSLRSLVHDNYSHVLYEN